MKGKACFQNQRLVFLPVICVPGFARKDNLNRHLLKHIDFNFYHCNQCGVSIPRQESLNQHQFREHQVGGKRKLENDNQPPYEKRLKKTLGNFTVWTKLARKKFLNLVPQILHIK